MKPDRLQGFLQQSGIASRRSLRQAIHKGEITVNGVVASDPKMIVSPGKDKIYFRGIMLNPVLQKRKYYLFHKPVSVLSTLSDPSDRLTISDFITDIRERIYPVGRLDYNSEGLMLLTDDGDLANLVMSPRNRVPKEYQVKIKAEIRPGDIAELEKGIMLKGKPVMPFKVKIIKKTPAGNSWLQVIVHEGKKHLIRNAFFQLGYSVLKLKRTAIGNFRLGRLQVGLWRELTAWELEEFRLAYNPRSGPISRKPDQRM